MLLDEELIASHLPTTVDSFDPVPAGDYTAVIIQAEVRPTKDGGGEYIKLRFDITGPSHQGRVVFANLNTKNASAKAAEIGRGQLKSVMLAIGLPSLRDTDQLIGGVVGIRLGVRPSRTDERSGLTYGASNEIRSYRSLSAAPETTFNVASPAKAATARERISADNGKASPPWARKV